MWHLHWRAPNSTADTSLDGRRRARVVEPTRTTEAGTDTWSGRTRGSFQHVWHDTPAAMLAGAVPESVRVRGR
ncbi:hypothetical protein [Actinomycetospora lemnae]|uniref:Uncharacterized protein n=1 Tax=Actinomycetospora lemnae TaxID=3019891 RepID=A0ABT5SQC3_9PSEU|nr:hypothetical protein [Actinomycetospora sp. DW7H6]MDD7963978.1 hypothetical protein [Actinomycetospora sp. DW7H6]